MVRWATSTATINGCLASCTVSGETRVGGILGEGNADMQNCAFVGDIVCTGNYGGGLGGTINGNIRNCSVFGSFQGSPGAGQGGYGGFLGNGTARVTTSFTSMAFDAGGTGWGCFAGNLYSGSRIEHCVADAGRAGTTRTAAQGAQYIVNSEIVSGQCLMQRGTYAGWDFDAIWKKEDNTYPYLFGLQKFIDNIPCPEYRIAYEYESNIYTLPQNSSTIVLNGRSSDVSVTVSAEGRKPQTQTATLNSAQEKNLVFQLVSAGGIVVCVDVAIRRERFDVAISIISSAQGIIDMSSIGRITLYVTGDDDQPPGGYIWSMTKPNGSSSVLYEDYSRMALNLDKPGEYAVKAVYQTDIGYGEDSLHITVVDKGGLREAYQNVVFADTGGVPASIINELQSAYQHAQTILNDPNADQDTIDRALAALQAANNRYQEAVGLFQPTATQQPGTPTATAQETTQTPTPTPGGLPGDINGDKKVDIFDILLVRDMIFGTEQATSSRIAAIKRLNLDTPNVFCILCIRDIIMGEWVA